VSVGCLHGFCGSLASVFVMVIWDTYVVFAGLLVVVVGLVRLRIPGGHV